MKQPTVQGEMIVLRPIGPGDVDAVWDLVQDPQARRLAGMVEQVSRAQVEARCTSPAEDESSLDLAVTANGSDEYLGEISLYGINRAVGRAGLRLLMRPAYRGRGYGTEAIQLLLGLAFDGLGLHRVGADVLSINTRALSMYENLGFRPEGRLREAARDGERWCDVVVLGILDDEYRVTEPV